MPVLLLFTVNTSSPNSTEAFHSPDIGRTTVGMGKIGVGVGVGAGVEIGVSIGVGAGTGVSFSPVGVGIRIVGVGLSVGLGDRVGVDIGASFSTHPANITTATIANMAIKPALLLLFIITIPFYFYFL